ncbi:MULTISPECIES: ArsR/SmtB family transcription factor [Bacillaceae]|uniref:Transcriptional regulator n=1 Tax=Cytobacillus horneckiae TaxID=549687 RepID=A0A2N0ZAL5_9BACI|nr:MULTISPECIES: metalloregulator ArsR/SmtB family transcription factor [Bacillaceae]MEC1158915.1 metalloregulator ArsR/SmtB family transcription factor [Cytobacillus horneckiae]PKG26558.1 transcriptional regulator [Cytobacillus horneckiae]TES50330.1 transcriptional regulator [Halalkalibacterium halodurans]
MVKEQPVLQLEDLQHELIAKFFHGLSNPARFKIAVSLLESEKNVSQLVHELGMKQSQISNQLACLKWCGYVSTRQEGKFIYYRITDERIRNIIELARQVVADNAEHINCCTRI